MYVLLPESAKVETKNCQCRRLRLLGLTKEKGRWAEIRAVSPRPGSSILSMPHAMYRYWGLEWILRIHHLQCCVSLTTKDLSLMLGRDCNVSVQSIRLSCQRLAVDFGWHGERGNFFADVLKVNIWDPSDLKYLIDAMKSFIPNAAMVIKPSFQPMLSSIGTTMADQSGFTYSIVLIDDEIVKISAILLQPSSPEESQPLNEELMMQYTSEEVLKQRMAHILNPINPKSKASAGKLCDMSVVYVCELPEIKGKFDPAKAVAFGLKPGPKYRELQLGNSVKSDLQNIMVHPSDVMGPSVPGPIVLLVDCPTESHLQELLSVQCLDSYYADFSGTPESSKVVTCIIHLSPASIVSTSNYQKWMERFGAAQHIMAGHERKNVEIPILKSTARITARLNYLCPQFFPASGFLSLRHLDCSEPGAIVSSEGSVLKLCKSISAKNLLKATFEDDMLDEAIARHHSTTKEAIEVGNSCRAYRIILTHFSQRYPKIPEFDETHMHNTCIAFDMMSVNIADLPVLPKVLPFFKLLFRNETMLDDSDDITDTVNDES
ncbi:tRNAse Z TRZ4, mitochondrial isoform X3 [Ziziphus jujuba]|uniref:ribonuclease Z n=1 Tax=Ziziphus jujuba TaxID=326968 RepID=A0ABM4A429_ZIZJJ|nr:tRNAse Z TRZ4, mitochondrial isoform X3 [Ziziphus jujuba]